LILWRARAEEISPAASRGGGDLRQKERRREEESWSFQCTPSVPKYLSFLLPEKQLKYILKTINIYDT
jgi:hypothetical protein